MSAPRAADAPGWRLCIAPMMQRTDRHFRYLARLLTPSARLYTEMITAGAILHGPRERLLAHAPAEHPLAVQLGGSVPAELAAAARLCAAAGFDEINLNCGCPSDRVQAGTFGACLMASPARVATCVKAMQDALGGSPCISIKTRLGIDHLYSYAYLRDFIATQVEAGCRIFHIHARKAWLSGLSPKENREIPPLEYAWVYRLKREMPGLVIVINGGIDTPGAALRHLEYVDGVMLGRHAYAVPFSLSDFEAALFGAPTERPSLGSLLARYLPYVEAQLEQGTELKHISRHLLNLFQGQPGARQWRRYLTEHATLQDAAATVITQALHATQPAGGTPAHTPW